VTKLPTIDSALAKQLRQYKLQKIEAAKPTIRPGNQPCLQKRPPKQPEKLPQKKPRVTSIKLSGVKEEPTSSITAQTQ
jgi:hypothetical protein